MELLLMHLALDKIGVTYEWSAELPCACSHGVPPLARPAWDLYEAIMAGALLYLIMTKLAEKEE